MMQDQGGCDVVVVHLGLECGGSLGIEMELKNTALFASPVSHDLFSNRCGSLFSDGHESHRRGKLAATAWCGMF